jgi:hypothetical protein
MPDSIDNVHAPFAVEIPRRSDSPTALIVFQPREPNVGTLRHGKSNRAATASVGSPFAAAA